MKELGYYIISADLCGIAPYRREIFYKKTLLQYVEKNSIEEYSKNSITEMGKDVQVG